MSESEINWETSIIVWKDFIESPVWIVLNGFMNAVPWFNWSWVALQQAIEQTKNMRILRALDLLELFNDEDFQKRFLESEQALDWFWQCYEAIIRERNQEKRKIIKNIFLWFTKLSEKEKKEFELERLLDINHKILISEIELLRHIHDFTKWNWAKPMVYFCSMIKSTDKELWIIKNWRWIPIDDNLSLMIWLWLISELVINKSWAEFTMENQEDKIKKYYRTTYIWKSLIKHITK